MSHYTIKLSLVCEFQTDEDMSEVEENVRDYLFEVTPPDLHELLRTRFKSINIHLSKTTVYVDKTDDSSDVEQEIPVFQDDGSGDMLAQYVEGVLYLDTSTQKKVA